MLEFYRCNNYGDDVVHRFVGEQKYGAMVLCHKCQLTLRVHLTFVSMEFITHQLVQMMQLDHGMVLLMSWNNGYNTSLISFNVILLLVYTIIENIFHYFILLLFMALFNLLQTHIVLLLCSLMTGVQK